MAGGTGLPPPTPATLCTSFAPYGVPGQSLLCPSCRQAEPRVWGTIPSSCSLPPGSARSQAHGREGCTGSCFSGCWTVRLAKRLPAWLPWSLCLQHVLLAGRLVSERDQGTGTSHQCLGLGQFSTEVASRSPSSNPVRLPWVIIASQQRFANRRLEIKSWCHARGRQDRYEMRQVYEREGV